MLHNTVLTGEVRDQEATFTSFEMNITYSRFSEFKHMKINSLMTHKKLGDG